MKVFRETLTILAGLLVLALSAALAGPYFVDWDAHRGRIEAQLAQATGLPLKIAGAIDIKILPSPRFVLGGVKLESSGVSTFSAERLTAEIAALPLLRGRLQFTELAVDKPVAELALGADGAPQWPWRWPRDGAPSPAEVALEGVTVTNGSLAVVRPPEQGGRIALGDIALDFSAQSLAGPWRGEAAFAFEGRRYAAHFNTGVAEGDRLRVKFALSPADASARAEFDGALDLAATPFLEGQAKLTGTLPLAELLKSPDAPAAPWEASGPVRIDPEQATIEPLDLRIGAEERGFKARGAVSYRAGEARVAVRLDAQRIDIDEMRGARGKGGASERQTAVLLQSLIATAGPLPRVGVTLKTPVVILDGEPLSDVVLQAEPADERMARVKFSAGLPGRASISLDGAVETGAAARYAGKMTFAARDPGRLSQWIRESLPTLGARLSAAPFGRFEFSGDTEISAAGFFARNLVISADRSRLQGHVSATQAVGGERARFAADLVSQALDLDQAPDLTPFVAGAGDIDLAISLDARAVRVARVGQGMIDAGRIQARLRRTGGALEIEQLDIAGLGGASLRASGRADAEGAQASVKLDAERLVEFAQLLKRVVPGIWSDALARRAAALSPATLNFSARAGMRAGALHPLSVEVEGTMRGTRISGAFKPAQNDADVLAGRLGIANAQTPELLRQLGFDTTPLEKLPPGRIDVEVSARAGSPFEARVEAALAGVAIGWRGRARALLPQPDLRGPLTISSKDASPLLQILALALPDAASRAPVELSGDFAAQGGRYSLGGISGEALGSKLAGALGFGGEGGRRLAGDLQLDRLSLEGLAALALGPRPPARGNAIWPDFRFAAALADPPPSSISVAAGRVLLPGGAEGENARFTLDLAPGLAAASNLSMKLAGGALRGRAALRRDGANVSVSGDLSFDGPLDMRMAQAARVQASMEFAGAGSSYAAIVAGLAGKGRAAAERLTIPGADAGALERVVSGTLDMLDITETRVGAMLGAELAKGARVFERAAFDLSLAGGRLSFMQEGDAPFVATADLRRMTLDAYLRFAMAAPEGWNSPPPEAAVRWQGPLGEPRRSLVFASLLNGLGARAIERESARIEMLEFEARERAAYIRRQRAAEFLEQREKEIAAFHVEEERRRQEEARRVLEEQKKAEEEARRKALEEQRAAARRAAAEAERERREREKPPAVRPAPTPAPATGAPLQLAPQPHTGAPAPLNDPAAAGRY